MTPAEIADAARALLTDAEVLEPSSTRIAARAVQACEALSRHLARLLGEMGVRALFNRSLILTRTRFPWIANVAGTAGESPWAPLRASMELQDPDTAVNAYADFLSTFAQLLGRLIGEALVSHLLQEIWPQVFPRAVKEPM